MSKDMNPRANTLPTAHAALERDIVRQHTDAPLRLRGDFVFDAPKEKLFDRVTDPGLIASWFAMVKSGEMDHSASCNVGYWGAGSKRYCQTRGMGDLDETILHYEAPHAYVYNVKNWMMPVKNHAAVMILEAINARRTQLSWYQYFDFKGVVMRHIFPSVMLSMMNSGLSKLREELGGEPSEMVRVA